MKMGVNIPEDGRDLDEVALGEFVVGIICCEIPVNDRRPHVKWISSGTSRSGNIDIVLHNDSYVCVA